MGSKKMLTANHQQHYYMYTPYSVILTACTVNMVCS